MINLCIIGCGHWGPNHIRVFSSLKDCTVVAIADTSEKRLAAAGEMFPHVRRFKDYGVSLHYAG
jgi:predicted dehydrogenase